MSQCTKCSNDIYDFDELKYDLCWDCMSKDDSLIDKNPDIGDIKDNEVINDGDSGQNERYSVRIRSRDGSSTVSELDKSKIADENQPKSSKPKKTTTVNKKAGDKKVSQDEIVPGANDEPPPPTSGGNENGKDGKKEPKTTTEPKPKPAPKKSDEKDDGEQKLIRESKETITKSSRAKTRAFSLINQAMKETGIFEVAATVDGKRMTVASLPYKERNVEDIVMTTTMEVIDAETTNNKKKR